MALDRLVAGVVGGVLDVARGRETSMHLLLQFVRSRFINIRDLAKTFDLALFTPDVYACIACNARDYRSNDIIIPLEVYTSELLHRLVHCDRKSLDWHNSGILCTSKDDVRNVASKFPPSAFTQDICNTLVLKLKYPLRDIPAQFRTRALMNELIRRGKINTTLIHFDPSFMDDAALALFAASMESGVIQFLRHGELPDAVTSSRALLLLAVEKQLWASIDAFCVCVFNQSICDQMSSTEAFVLRSDALSEFPATYRTASVFANALQFRPSMYVPPELQDEVKRLRRVQARSLARNTATDVPRAIQKRRKRHDWAARKRT